MEARQEESCTGRGRSELCWEVRKAGDYIASQLASEECAYMKSRKYGCPGLRGEGNELFSGVKLQLGR